MDVAIQQIARVEEELVMIRGRVAGTADSGRLFLVPYEKVVQVYVNRPVRAEEVELFSPSVSAERKREVARNFQALIERERAQTRQAEAERGGGGGAPKTDVRKQLESLRELAGLGPQETAQQPQSQPQSQVPTQQNPNGAVLPGVSRMNTKMAVTKPVPLSQLPGPRGGPGPVKKL